MRTSFLHMADVHLGNAQYGRSERAQDFARAFHRVVEYAVDRQAGFVLVAGDLFESASLDPVTFHQVLVELEELRKAHIPVVDIAGNHDRMRYGQGMPWVKSLGHHGFLYYLDAVDSGSVELSPWSEEQGIGGYVELKGVRIVGVRYLGAQTNRLVGELAEKLRAMDSPDRPFTVAMLHAGLDGVVPNFRAELTYDQLAPLRGLVDYVALGHVHQHYEREGWVYNPGSLETWNASEAEWKRGFLHVQVDTSAEPKHRAELIEPPRRPFLRRRLDVEPCANPSELAESTRRNAREWRRDARGERPVVHVTLVGRLRFDRGDLDLGALEAELVAALHPLVVQIRDQTDETAFRPDVGADGLKLDREALELDVLRQLFANDERRVHRASTWASLAQTLKQGALSRESPEALAATVRQQVEDIA